MKKKLGEHILSIILVTAVFAVLIAFIQVNRDEQAAGRGAYLQEYLELPFLDFGDPLDKALFKDALNAMYPDSSSRNDSLVHAIEEFRREQFTNQLYKSGSELKGLTWSKAESLLAMYVQFIVIYFIVLSLSYYAAQVIGIVRFVQLKQGRASYLAELLELWRKEKGGPIWLRKFLRSVMLFLKACLRGCAYSILFSPAYVIAYSFKTRFDTDSNFFMILLGVISNGLLINYANRFFTFLVSESRKGYVETAVVKNLNNSYMWNRADGISWKSVLQLRKEFPAHVFQHICINARHQFRSTLKEHASFLVTGLVIIEMALNIQGHLSYEMLKNILYKQYDVVLAIVLTIFLLVKATELAVDVWTERESRKYENRNF